MGVRVVKGQAWREVLRLDRWRRQRDRLRPTGGTTTMASTATTTTEAPATGPVGGYLNVFRGGPFDQWTCRGLVPGVGPRTPPGTLTLSIPFPLDPGAAIAWGQAVIRWETHPSPSQRGRWAVYCHVGPAGHWEYVPE